MNSDRSFSCRLPNILTELSLPNTSTESSLPDHLAASQKHVKIWSCNYLLFSWKL